ncbi:hypothetical protein [Prosthecobacter sp.]|uniref:hypothetical protein n=1 Tax=Prosthecobacter sp. TaxID=1965333 RepID=UPI0037846E25
MKNPLLTLALPLLLLAAVFYGMRSPSPAPAPIASPTRSAPGVTQPSRLAIPSQADQQASFDAARQKIEAANEKLREHATKAFASMTPKTERLLVDAVMRFREPRCRDLFKTWNLDAETADTAIKLIAEREAEVMARGRDFLRAGIDGAADYRTQQSVNKALADVQLTALLGEARSAELRKLEKQLDAEYRVRARASANARANAND